MAFIRPVDVNEKDNRVPLDETYKVVQETSTVREYELEQLRNQVSLYEKELERLTEEYSNFLVDNSLIEEGVEPESVMAYPQINSFYDPDAKDGTNYVDRSNVMVPNPTFMPLSIALEEMNDILGPIGRKVDWYQNEMKKKYSLKMQMIKRIERIENRENYI